MENFAPTSSGISSGGAFCVELWLHQGKNKMLVPMFDISFWDCWDAGLVSFRLSGKVDFFSTCETKGACKFSKSMSQKSLNHVLTPVAYRSRRELPESSGFVEKG